MDNLLIDIQEIREFMASRFDHNATVRASLLSSSTRGLSKDESWIVLAYHLYMQNQALTDSLYEHLRSKK